MAAAAPEPEVARPLLSIRDLHVYLGGSHVLQGVTFDVPEGGVTALLGRNGVGKTTTVRAILGLTGRRGSVTLAGEELTSLPTHKIVRRGFGYVPEDRDVFTGLTVEENLRLGAYTRRDAAVRADLDRWYEVFPRLGERRRQQAANLSGGEQQMLAIARALLLRPRLLLLDEPSLGLAPLVTRELFAVLGQVKREHGTTMLLVEQNANLALELADHAYVLEAGRTVLAGPAADIRTDEHVRRAYLGL